MYYLITNDIDSVSFLLLYFYTSSMSPFLCICLLHFNTFKLDTFFSHSIVHNQGQFKQQKGAIDGQMINFNINMDKKRKLPLIKYQ